MAGAINSRLDNWRPASVHVRCRKRVAKAFGVEDDMVMTRTRLRPVVKARQAAMYVLREQYGLSYPCIGVVMGGYDHSTIIHGCEQTRNRMERDPDMTRIIDVLAKGCEVRVFDAHVVAWLLHNEDQRNVRRATLAVARKQRNAAIVAEDQHRRVKPKNQMDDDDLDALDRCSASTRLSDAIAAAGGWPTQGAAA